MDSGIDSTESSNQSVGEGPVTLFGGVEPTVRHEVDSVVESCNNNVIHNGEPFTPPSTLNRESNAVDMAAPNSLRSLAAAAAGSKTPIEDELKEKTAKSSIETEYIIQQELEQMNKMVAKPLSEVAPLLSSFYGEKTISLSLLASWMLQDFNFVMIHARGAALQQKLWLRQSQCTL